MEKANHNQAELLLKKLCLNEDFADVIFIVEQERVPAHRNILAASSEYFRALLYGDFAESEKKEVELDANLEAFKFLLRYIYTGCDLSGLEVDLIIDVLKVAKEYGYTNLVSKIADNLITILNTENLGVIMNNSHLYELQNVYNRALKHVEDHTFLVIESKSFNSFSKEVIFDIIGRDSFSVYELDIFKAVMRWGEDQTTEDLQFVLSNVRFTLMQISELRDVVAPTGVLKPEDIDKMIEDIKTVKCLPYRNGETHRNQLSCYKITNRTEFEFKFNDRIKLIELPEETWINHTSLKTVTGAYRYNLEISRDKREWTRVADFKSDKYGEHSWYFDACMVRYIYLYCQYNFWLDFSICEIEVDIDYFTFPPMIVDGVPALTYFNKYIKEEFQEISEGNNSISFRFKQQRYINCMTTTTPFINSEMPTLSTSADGEKFQEIKYQFDIHGKFLFFDAHIVQFVKIVSHNYSKNSFLFFFNQTKKSSIGIKQ